MKKLLLGSLGLGIIAALLASLSVPALAASAPSLGSAANFAVLAGASVTSSGATSVTGDVGVSPGTTVSGFPPGIVDGAIYAGDVRAAAAIHDASAAYSSAVGQTCSATIANGDLTGVTLPPGVHCLPSSGVLNGTVTLDAQGNTSAVFIVKVSGSLTTAGSAAVTLTGGASACNVYWVVSDFARVGALTSFKGNIIAVNEARLSNKSRLEGRLISTSGVARLDNAFVSKGNCPAGPTPTATATETSTYTETSTATETTTGTATETTTGTSTNSPTVTTTTTTSPTVTTTNTTTTTVTTTVTTTHVTTTVTSSITVTITRTITVTRSPTGVIPPNTGGAEIVGGNDDVAVMLGLGMIGVAMVAGASFMLFRRRAV